MTRPGRGARNGDADVVVLGAGPAGLAAALAFGRRGRRVVVLERDPPVASGGADALYEDWERPGIPHFRQAHNILGLARAVLHEEVPDVLARLLDLGATENRQYELLPGEVRPEDESLVSIFARRPVFEYALRSAVEAEDGVTLQTGTRVAGLRDGTVVVTGDGEEIAAPLVVDALGRTSPVPRWLGLPERRSECGLLYYSRHFRFRDGADMPAVASLTRAPRGEIGYLAYSIFVEDSRTFATVLMPPTWDRELRAFKSEDAYMAAVSAIPALAAWVHPDRAEPISPVLPMGSLQNVQRRSTVAGVQPVGDALCHLDPTFAWGVSLALHHGFTLARIADETDDPAAIALAFDDAVGADAAARFDAVTAEDRDRARLWQGEPLDVRTPSDSMALFLRMTAYPAAAKDPDLFRAVARRVNLLDPPDALERDEALIARAQEIAQANDAVAPIGPSRDALLETIRRSS